MINLLAQYQEWSQNVIGKRLSRVNGLIYVLESPDFTHPQQVQLIFDNTEKLAGLGCGRDGATLELKDIPFKEKDLGEYGSEITMDISNLPSFNRYIGGIISKIHLIFSSLEDTYIGVKLSFEEHSNLIILNIGDEINILDSLSESYIQENHIKCQKL